MIPVRVSARFAAPATRCRKQRNRIANQRCGFSLLELILVMTILVAFAALSLPTVQRTINRQALVKGADLMRASMGRARVKAIKTGKIHAVFYLPNSGYHTVAPFDQASEQAQLASTRQAQVDSGRVNDDFAEDMLPRGIRFAAAAAEVDGRAAEVFAVNATNSTLKPILFYPDGTSQDAKILLQNPQGETYQILLRGLTGTSTSTRVVEQ